MSIAYVAIGTTVASVATSALGSRAARKGAEAGAEADREISAENVALQRELALQQREDFAPWRDVGEQALNQLWEGVQSGQFKTGAIDVTKDPGYQFRIDEGIKARDRSAAARGKLVSGAQDKALTRYAQNYASDEYARAYARDADEKNRQFNILNTMSNQGQASAAGQASSSAQLATNTGNILSRSASVQNQALVNQGTARASGYQDAATAVNQGAQNYLLYNALQ